MPDEVHRAGASESPQNGSGSAARCRATPAYPPVASDRSCDPALLWGEQRGYRSRQPRNSPYPNSRHRTSPQPRWSSTSPRALEPERDLQPLNSTKMTPQLLPRIFKPLSARVCPQCQLKHVSGTTPERQSLGDFNLPQPE